MPTEGCLSRKEEERVWILSMGPLVPVVLCVIAYFAHLRSISVIPSDQVMFSYTLLLGVSICAAGAGIYEVVSSFKVKRPISFRVKRYLSRITFSSIYLLGLFLLWNLFTVSFSSVLKEEYIVILSLLTASLVLGVLISRPKTRRLIKKFTREEN